MEELVENISMVKLTSKEEKVRKKLEKFPHGVKATQLMRELHMTKTPLYEALNSLEIKSKAFRGEHNLWLPKPAEPSQKLTVLEQLMREDAAETEIMMLREKDPEFNKKVTKIKRKYGLL